MRTFIGALAFLPTVAFAAPRTFSELADLFLVYINAGIGIALITGIVIYFYGIATNLHKAGESEATTLRTHLLWGMVALFVMFSVWGILAILRNTLFGGGAGYGFDKDADLKGECISFDDCIVGY